MIRSTFKKAHFLLLGALTLGLASCMRGGISHDPPVHLVLDMDFQPKLRTQSATEFEGFADHRAMRLPVADAFGKTLVVARGSLADDKFQQNKDASGQYVKTNPLALDTKWTYLGREVSVLERGRDRFNVYCAICHGYSGLGGNDPKQGHGLVGRRWPAAIPNFHFQPGEGKDNRVPLMADGEYFDVITYGKGTMPAYGARISPEDRWAIVHYVRALQQLSK